MSNVRSMDDTSDEKALDRMTDQQLQALWREGVESGDAGEIDSVALKAEARAQR